MNATSSACCSARSAANCRDSTSRSRRRRRSSVLGCACCASTGALNASIKTATAARFMARPPDDLWEGEDCTAEQARRHRPLHGIKSRYTAHLGGRMKRPAVRVAALLALLLLIGAALVYIRYRNDIRAARARVNSGSQVVDTPCG